MDGMPINDKNTPVTLPHNEFTEMIELIKARNAGAPIDISSVARRGVPISGIPLPSARSADIGVPVEQPIMPPPDRPLTAEEIEELNRAALASGLVKGPVNPSIANTLNSPEEVSAYATLEDAIRAGAPIDATAEQIEAGAIAFREPTPAAPIIRVRAPIGGQRVAPGSVGVPTSEPSLPKLPDFKKVQMIDLVNGKLYVDGISFELTPDELRMLRKFSVRKAKDQIQATLDAALKALEATDEGDAGAA